MSRNSFKVNVFRNKLEKIPEGSIEIEIGTSMPVAYTALKTVLSALKDVEPNAVKQAASKHPTEWNRLFPGTFDNVPELESIALSPSERRLHRESEQVFQVLNSGAEVILEAVRALGRPVVFTNAGAADIVSLRALMRAVEWLNLEEVEGLFLFGNWDASHQFSGPLFTSKRKALLETIRTRMGAEVKEGGGKAEPCDRDVPSEEFEERWLRIALDEKEKLEKRVAAAVLTIRACFYTTNYEASFLAADQGLKLLDQCGPDFSQDKVLHYFEALDDEKAVDTQAIEIDEFCLQGFLETRAFFWRIIGVIHALVNEPELALEAFSKPLGTGISPEHEAQVRMYRALSLSKRLGKIPDAIAEAEAGLACLKDLPGERAMLETGWIRNVYALCFFMSGRHQSAFQQEKLALAAVGKHQGSQATHLKINLISNISVLLETGKRFPDSIKAWDRFHVFGDHWGDCFTMHHNYRGAGLRFKAGAVEDATKGYQVAFDTAVHLGTDYYQQAIASNMGRLHLDRGSSSEAANWYEKAIANAKKTGDPYRLAEGLVGLGLATSQKFPHPKAQAILKKSTTYVSQAQKMSAALDQSDRAGLMQMLPGPRTKLNQPFELVNL